MSEHDVDQTLSCVHLHDGPFSRTNTINLRSLMSHIHKAAQAEARETGRPLGECAREHAHAIMLDHLETNYPRENGQWVHRPNFGWVFEKEDDVDSLNHSWKRSEHANYCQMTSSSQNRPVVIRTAEDEDSYINSIKPKPVVKTSQGLHNQTFAKSKRVNRLARRNDYEYYSDDELEDIPQNARGAAPQSVPVKKRPAGFNLPLQAQGQQNGGSNDDDGLPISDIQKLFMNVFNKD